MVLGNWSETTAQLLENAGALHSDLQTDTLSEEQCREACLVVIIYAYTNKLKIFVV